MFGLEEKNSNKQLKKGSTKVSSKSSQADEAKAILDAMEQKKKDKPDDCVFC